MGDEEAHTVIGDLNRGGTVHVDGQVGQTLTTVFRGEGWTSKCIVAQEDCRGGDLVDWKGGGGALSFGGYSETKNEKSNQEGTNRRKQS